MIVLYGSQSWFIMYSCPELCTGERSTRVQARSNVGERRSVTPRDQAAVEVDAGSCPAVPEHPVQRVRSRTALGSIPSLAFSGTGREEIRRCSVKPWPCALELTG